MVHIFQMANDTVHNHNSLQVITKNNGNKWTQPKHIRFWFHMQWHKLIGKKPTTALLLYLFFWFVLKNSLAYFIFRYLNINGCCKVHINNQQYDFENVNTFCTKSHQIAQLWLFFFALFCHVIHLQRHFYFGKLGFKSCETKRCIVRVLRIVFDHWTKEIIEQKRAREKKNIENSALYRELKAFSVHGFATAKKMNPYAVLLCGYSLHKQILVKDP